MTLSVKLAYHNEIFNFTIPRHFYFVIPELVKIIDNNFLLFPNTFFINGKKVSEIYKNYAITEDGEVIYFE